MASKRATVLALILGMLLAPTPQSAVAADPRRGKELYAARCGACHSLTDNGAGPRHTGLLGRKAGTQPGFDYSQALKNSGILWTESQLDRWLTDPNILVPGNKMAVRLANDPRDRADIIAFLRKVTRRTQAPHRAVEAVPGDGYSLGREPAQALATLKSQGGKSKAVKPRSAPGQHTRYAS